MSDEPSFCAVERIHLQKRRREHFLVGISIKTLCPYKITKRCHYRGLTPIGNLRQFWRRFTTYAKVGVGLQTCIFRTPQRRSSVTDHTDRSCVLELPRNDLEIFAIGHVVASLHGYQDSGGDFQLELRTRLRLVKPRILLMSK